MVIPRPSRDWVLGVVLGPALLAAAAGCGSARADDRVNVEVVCASETSSSCEVPQLIPTFDEWARGAVSNGGTFSVWRAGIDRNATARQFRTCVPDRWRGAVMAAKAEYVVAARAALRASLGDAAPVIHGSPDCPDIGGTHRIGLVGGTAGATIRVWLHSESDDRTTSLHVAVICDRSSSTEAIACNRGLLQVAFDHWAGETVAPPSASFSVYLPGTSRDTTRLVYSAHVPRGSPGRRLAYLAGARRELQQLLPKELDSNASALVEAIHVAASELRERTGRYRLVIASDGRQVSPGVWNFERAVPVPATFIAWLRRTRMLADLREFDVIACGFHHRRGFGEVGNDPLLAVKLHDVWKGSLAAMQAPTARLNASCDTAFGS
jgi:hypothetical protein